MPFPEMLNIIPGYDRRQTINKTLAEQSKNATVDQAAPAAGNVTANATSATNSTALKSAGASTKVPMDFTGRNVYGESLSYPYFPWTAKAEQISGMSLLDRMWRNAHLATMGCAYEGDTSRPVWILPTEFTKSAIAMANWYNVNDMALAYTTPGMHLERRFWDLGLTGYHSPFFDTVKSSVPEVGAPVKPVAPTPTPTPTPTPKPNNTTVSGGNRSDVSMPTNISIVDWINNSSMMLKTQLNTSAPGNISSNITAGGTPPSAIRPPASWNATSVYVPAWGPAGNGIDWPFKGPHQLAWMGGPYNPWVMGPSTNPVYPGMGGPDWPPYYWGFGRYKGWS